MKKARFRITQENKKTMKKLYAYGLSFRKISQKIGCNPGVVSYWLNPDRRNHVINYAGTYALIWRSKNLDRYRAYQRQFHREWYHKVKA